MWEWKKRSYMFRMAILVEKAWLNIFIIMERKIQVKNFGGRIWFWIFFPRRSKPHFPTSPSFYIWNVVWNSYSYIYLQFLDQFLKKGRGGKSSKSVWPVDEISMRNSSLFERLAIKTFQKLSFECIILN